MYDDDDADRPVPGAVRVVLLTLAVLFAAVLLWLGLGELAGRGDGGADFPGEVLEWERHP